jgi:hypothetical protein
MRKRLITAAPQVGPRTDQNWLDLGSVATVEVTSETKDHPVESSLLLIVLAHVENESQLSGSRAD